MQTIPHRLLFPVLLAAVCAVSTACASAAPPAGALPETNTVAGWTVSGKIRTYNRETLFDYIDGSSEYFFTYSFKEVAVGRYADAAGAEISVEVWQLADAADAFGLFSGRPGIPSTSLGAAGGATLETESRLIFWQNHYYVTVTALDSASDAVLRGFGEFISKKLPAGGEPPALIAGLPAGGLIAGSPKYFHQELAIQDKLWLGGENLLGLGTDAGCAYAEYQLGGGDWQLLLVQYPEAARAQAGLLALKSGAADDVAAADVNGTLLGAVIGQGDPAAAQALLKKALGR
jgi:hypothetical protein